MSAGDRMTQTCCSYCKEGQQCCREQHENRKQRRRCCVRMPVFRLSSWTERVSIPLSGYSPNERRQDFARSSPAVPNRPEAFPTRIGHYRSLYHDTVPPASLGCGAASEIHVHAALPMKRCTGGPQATSYHPACAAGSVVPLHRLPSQSAGIRLLLSALVVEPGSAHCAGAGNMTNTPSSLS